MCLAQGPQRSDTGEAQTRGLLISSQALYHWAESRIDQVVYDQKKYQRNGFWQIVEHQYNK